MWLFLAVVYDGLFLLSLVIFKDYPIDKLSLLLTITNPIDLSRILILLKMDISALIGYTGAVFNKFLGTNLGMITSLIMLLPGMVAPVVGFLQSAKRKDF